MKKMLVVFLILFTKVLADSEEDNYVDLLPDEEKQQFLEKVARRILKDVESQENVTGAQSGDLSDEQLKQHTEYVKAVLKEEQENVRRNKGDNVKDEDGKSTSDEKENLGVKPLGTEKVSLPDLTLREEKRDTASDESTKNNITIEIITDNAPIIKRSVQDDNANNSYESDETTSETFNRVSKTNVTAEESNIVEVTSEKVENGNDATETKVLSGKDSKINGSTTAGDENDESESVDSNQSVSSESSAHNVSVKGINEPLLRRSNSNDSILAGNTTEINTTITTVESTKSTKNKSDEYNNVSSANEEFTTQTYPFTTSSIKDTTTDSPLSTTTITTNKDKDSDPLLKSTNYTSKDTENEVGTTTKSTRTSTFNNEETTESVPLTTEFVSETTKLVPITTEIVPETTIETKIMTTEAVTESTTVLMTTENPTGSIPVVTTKDTKIVVEDFTSAPTIKTSFESTTLKPRKITKKKKKQKLVFKPRALSEELTTVGLASDEESVEATTKKKNKHKVIVHKAHKYIVGPKAKKIAEEEKDPNQNKNFIELEKKYYDNNYKVKVGKQYHVFEIPADKSPFVKDEEPIADQPYYVPIYNYSPNNAYFNPKNRLGPNAGDSSAENNGDDLNQLDNTETLNIKMEYDKRIDSKRKKFGSKQKLSHSIHKPPLASNEHRPGKIKPEDYLDSDYYFGRVRKELARRVNEEKLAKLPNSDETDHPARSIQEGSLKDHVRAVRNILFQQKSFGLLEKDKYGENVVYDLKMGRQRSEAKQGIRKGRDDDLIKIKNNKNNDKDKENNIAFDYYFGREKPTIITSKHQDGINNIHVQKVGYLKNKNDRKELYVMDDFFKANVEKYIQKNGFTPAPQLSYQATPITNLDQRDVVITNLKHQMKNQMITNTTQNHNDITVNKNEKSSTEKSLDVKLNLKRKDVIKVSVYLQVLKDMVTLDNKALVQYDWLGSTVDIQAALQKLFELTALIANKKDVHPADMEILKYVVFLHKLATEIIEANDFGYKLRKKLVLPKNTNAKLKPPLQKDKGLLNRVWLYLRKEVPEVNEHEALKHLNTFLIDVEDGLYDLHDAIKNIAKITKYRNQHWYQNLKDLYINTDEKHVLELLLHLASLRLFALIEESAKNGLEEDYIQYMKKNRKHSKRTLEEMMFIMDILEEYNKVE